MIDMNTQYTPDGGVRTTTRAPEVAADDNALFNMMGSRLFNRRPLGLRSGHNVDPRLNRGATVLGGEAPAYVKTVGGWQSGPGRMNAGAMRFSETEGAQVGEPGAVYAGWNPSGQSFHRQMPADFAPPETSRFANKTTGGEMTRKKYEDILEGQRQGLLSM